MRGLKKSPVQMQKDWAIATLKRRSVFFNETLTPPQIPNVVKRFRIHEYSLAV
jgi:hypothetical protein